MLKLSTFFDEHYRMKIVFNDEKEFFCWNLLKYPQFYTIKTIIRIR